MLTINKEFIKPNCTKSTCSFYNNCTQCATEVIKTRNDSNIDLMFVGMGAGAEEDRNGRPFQGRAGSILRKVLLPKLECNNLNIVLDNTIRCRPLDQDGKNRPPTKNEVNECIPFLWKRIEELNPKVIIPLGASASGDLIPELDKKPISSIRGRIYDFKNRKFLPTFHPAAILHTGDEKTKQEYSTKMNQDIDLAISKTAQLSFI
jgi:DNA polymerase